MTLCLQGKFRGLLTNYFPDLIKAQKMVVPEAHEATDEDYDTDLDIDLGQYGQLVVSPYKSYGKGNTLYCDYFG